MTTVKRNGSTERAIYKKKSISHKDWYGSDTLTMPQKDAQEASDSPPRANPEQQEADK